MHAIHLSVLDRGWAVSQGKWTYRCPFRGVMTVFPSGKCGFEACRPTFQTMSCGRFIAILPVRHSARDLLGCHPFAVRISKAYLLLPVHSS